jgi:hypothetical protein
MRRTEGRHAKVRNPFPKEGDYEHGEQRGTFQKATLRPLDGYGETSTHKGPSDERPASLAFSEKAFPAEAAALQVIKRVHCC